MYHSKELAALLRNPDQWPLKDGQPFKWNFSNSNCCAMKIAQLHWTPERSGISPTSSEIAALIGISEIEASKIFVSRPRSHFWSNTYPEDIARDLDKVSVKQK